MRPRDASGGELEATLRALASADPGVLDAILGPEVENLEESGLDPHAHALVRFATLVALGAPSESFRSEVERALARGVAPGELLGTIVAAAPQVGAPRLVSAGRELLAALAASSAPDARSGGGVPSRPDPTRKTGRPPDKES